MIKLKEFFARFRWKRADRRHVKVNIVNAIELKPEANYILVVDGKLHRRTEVEAMLRELRRTGVRNVVSFMLEGSPDDAIQLISKEKKAHATAKTRNKHS